MLVDQIHFESVHALPVVDLRVAILGIFNSAVLPRSFRLSAGLMCSRVNFHFLLLFVKKEMCDVN